MSTWWCLHRFLWWPGNEMKLQPPIQQILLTFANARHWGCLEKKCDKVKWNGSNEFPGKSVSSLCYLVATASSPSCHYVLVPVMTTLNPTSLAGCRPLKPDIERCRSISVDRDFIWQVWINYTFMSPGDDFPEFRAYYSTSHMFPSWHHRQQAQSSSTR